VKRGRSATPSQASWIEYLDRRPIIVAIAGPNGAGKTTFFESHLRTTGLRFLNADVVAREMEAGAYEAAQMISALRTELVAQRESFIFETVFSDPAATGYAVVLCFVGISSAKRSEERVAMRVSQGGHDVPAEKLVARFPRTLVNLAAAIRDLPCVLVYDNDDLDIPFRQVAVYMDGRTVQLNKPVPAWLRAFP
jgi:predicted ABC-type ATPase